MGSNDIFEKLWDPIKYIYNYLLPLCYFSCEDSLHIRENGEDSKDKVNNLKVGLHKAPRYI